MKALKMQHNETGFTLVELMITIAIIGILAALAGPLFAASRVKAFDVTAKSDLTNAMKSIDMYAINNNAFPASVADLQSAGFSLTKNVTFTRFSVGLYGDGEETLHMHVKHAGSPNEWHVNYPEDGSEIEIR